MSGAGWAAISGAGFGLFQALPKEQVPNEDRRQISISVQAPNAPGTTAASGPLPGTRVSPSSAKCSRAKSMISGRS